MKQRIPTPVVIAVIVVVTVLAIGFGFWILNKREYPDPNALSKLRRAHPLQTPKPALSGVMPGVPGGRHY